MSGHLSVVGLGPGDARWRTPEAEAALARAEVLYGYAGYLERVPTQLGQARHASDNREEAARAEASLRAAAAGRQVAIVTGGDPGVFAIANAVCEQIEAGPESFRQVEVTIIPGVSAMLAVAARVGAPLGGDFCAISLSDNLKPWELIEQRLAAAAGVGFVIALYNPISRARPRQLGKAFERLRALLPGETAVVFGRAIGRADESMRVTTLAAAEPSAADMATLIIIGSPETHVIERPGRAPLVYTSRSAKVACP